MSSADELHRLRAELLRLNMRHANDLATAWDAGWCDRHLGTHSRDDNPHRKSTEA